MAGRSAIITVMTQAAYKAARGLVRDFGEVENLQVSKKGPSDFVTAADIQAEKVLHAELAHARPTYGFLMEEGGEIKGEDAARRWIIDPLDGTLNFLHGLPQFAISIALQHGREIVAGVVYDPLRDELFHAEKGGGAYLNDRRMRVSARSRLDEAALATGIPWQGRGGHTAYLAQLGAVMDHCAGVRRFGAAALDLAYVAAGRCDGFWEPGLSLWDIAAGVLLVREAGGFVTDLAGGDGMLETGDVLAANDSLHGTLAALLARANPG
ncbi:MAG: inositol monophosphatase [Proteobacteria bacterium]|nr:inositol monophosphatase [Pseudomonadota bacterium]